MAAAGWKEEIVQGREEGMQSSSELCHLKHVMFSIKLFLQTEGTAEINERLVTEVNLAVRQTD